MATPPIDRTDGSARIACMRSEPRPTPDRRRPALLLALLTLLLDVAAKSLALELVGEGREQPLLSWLTVSPLYNRDGVLGLWGSAAELLPALIAGAIAALLWTILRPRGRDTRSLLALGAMLGVALSVLLDYLVTGGVLDYLALRLGDLRLPLFNLADLLLLVAALVYLRPAKSTTPAA